MSEKIRVLLVDDNPSFRKGMRALLEIQPDLCVVGESSDGRSVLDSIERLPPDLVLLDAQMPGMTSVEACRNIKTRWPRTKVAVMTMFNDHRRALEAGADAFLVKGTPPERLLAVLRGMFQGQESKPRALP